MTNNDEFDVDLELEDGAADDFADDAGFQEDEEPVQKKKSGGGFLVKFLLFLIVIGGGLFAAVKYMGVQIPYLSDMLGAPQPAVIAQQPAPQNAMAPLGDAGASTDDTASGADVAWADDTAATDNGDTVPAIGGMDDFTAMTAGDDAATTADTANSDAAEDAGFGLPPTTDDATDLSAMTGDATNNTAGDIGDVWGDVPATTTDAADFGGVNFDTAADTAADTTKMDAQTFETAPVVTDPVPAATTDNKAEETLKKEVAALEAEVTALEKSLADLKKETVSKTDSAALKAALAAIEKTAPAKADKTDAAPASTQAAKPAAAKPVVVRKAWVLRSAKPGMAWISEKGSTEIKTISVGDNVAGIGKVTDIAADSSGQWVVSGTRGKINQ